jgi:hypothetical protein
VSFSLYFLLQFLHKNLSSRKKAARLFIFVLEKPEEHAHLLPPFFVDADKGGVLEYGWKRRKKK